MQRVQLRPGDGREVVVLVVQTDVVGEDVQRAIVGVGFRGRQRVERVRLLLLVLLLVLDGLGTVLHVGEEIVLGNKVPGAGVQRAGEEGACNKVEERLERTPGDFGEGEVE